jgi:glycosyltransferase involved in cell wall biosynthesis
MHVLFIDPQRAYGARTSSEAPLGGSESAVTYLALALAQIGVRVTVANRRDDDVFEEGVAWRSLAAAQRQFAAFLAAQQVSEIVVLNASGVAALRDKVDWQGRWILWNHHWIDQSGVAALADPALRARWDLVVSVSEFHHRGMEKAFALDPARHVILRNAIAPHFAALWPDRDAFARDRAVEDPTRFIYTSTPFRGLDVLVDAWSQAPPSTWSCTVVSGMSLYGEADAQFASLFARVRATTRIQHVAPIGQRALAQLLARHDFWAYPCTWIETSCISALEAVAAGLYPLTTGLGALPETLGGFGTLLAPETSDLAGRWRAAAEAAVERRKRDPAAWIEALWNARARVVAEWQWSRRAQQWREQLAQSQV